MAWTQPRAVFSACIHCNCKVLRGHRRPRWQEWLVLELDKKKLPSAKIRSKNDYIWASSQLDAGSQFKMANGGDEDIADLLPRNVCKQGSIKFGTSIYCSIAEILFHRKEDSQQHSALPAVLWTWFQTNNLNHFRRILISVFLKGRLREN